MGLVEKLIVGWAAISAPVGVLLGRALRMRDRAAEEAMRRERSAPTDAAPTRRAS